MVKLFNGTKMPGMNYSWTGLALEQVEAQGKTIIIFGLGILVGVPDRWRRSMRASRWPFIILLAVPTAILGALGLVALRGLNDDVYVQIGMVMLIGLSAKNSILIVGVCREEIRRTGKSIIDSAIQAAELRLRPILMTSIAFILGVLPLYFATGAGSYGRHSVGTAVVGGMVGFHRAKPVLHPGTVRHPEHAAGALRQEKPDRATTDRNDGCRSWTPST